MKKTTMSDSKEEIIKVVTTAAMLSVLIGLIKALRSQKATLLARFRDLAISLVFGIFTGLIIKSLDLSEFKRSAIISLAAAFGNSVWPVLETIVVNWVSKKGEKIDDVLHNNNG